VEWWEAFQRGDQAEREALINEAKNSGADEPAKKRRRRRTSNRRRAESAGGGGEAE
jgi:poly(A) polymerase